MGYIDKVHKKIEIEKMVNTVMKDYRFKKYIQEVKLEATSDAFDTFLLIGADYLYKNFNCKQNGILKYIEFVQKTMGYIEDDPDYFVLLNKELENETGLNIMDNRMEAKGKVKYGDI